MRHLLWLCWLSLGCTPQGVRVLTSGDGEWQVLPSATVNWDRIEGGPRTGFMRFTGDFGLTPGAAYEDLGDGFGEALTFEIHGSTALPVHQPFTFSTGTSPVGVDRPHLSLHWDNDTYEDVDVMVISDTEVDLGTQQSGFAKYALRRP